MSRTKDNHKAATRQDPLRVLIERDARAFADFLTRQSEQLSRMQKKIILLTFGVLAAGAALTLIVTPFTSSTMGTKVSGETPAARRQILPPQRKQDTPQGTQVYLPALRVLDSLYRNDPKRLALILEQRLKRIDSLNANR